MSVSVAQQKMFVDGEFVDALSGETMEVLNPATGEVIAEVPRPARRTSTARSPPPRRRGRPGARRRRRTGWSSSSGSPT